MKKNVCIITAAVSALSLLAIIIAKKKGARR